MIAISYPFVVGLISLLWILCRILVWKNTGKVFFKREAELIPVYICLIVVARFALFALETVDGKVQPLLFDTTLVSACSINWKALWYLADYEYLWEMKVNIIGNIAMFIPIGIIWPAVFWELDTHMKVIAAGVGFSLLIEMIQIPLYNRVTDVDDLILNSLGFLIGYGIYLLAKKLKKK